MSGIDFLMALTFVPNLPFSADTILLPEPLMPMTNLWIRDNGHGCILCIIVGVFSMHDLKQILVEFVHTGATEYQCSGKIILYYDEEDGCLLRNDNIQSKPTLDNLD